MGRIGVGVMHNTISARFGPKPLVHADYVIDLACRAGSFWVADHHRGAGPHTTNHRRADGAGIRREGSPIASRRARRGGNTRRAHGEANPSDEPHVADLLPLVKATGLTGTAEQVSERIAQFAAAGVTEVVYQPAGSDIERELRAFASAAGLQS
jgi:hypothetical protein